MKRFLFLPFFFYCFSSTAQNCSSLRYKEEVFSSINSLSGIVYGHADPYGIIADQALTLDFYEPFGDTLSKRPVVVYAYGGAFLIGASIQPPIPYYADYFVKRGYVFVSINYRLGFNPTLAGSPERAVYRAGQDLRAALRHLAQRAQQYRIDTSKIILMGSSAGSITAFHSTYMEYAQAAAYATPIPLLDGETLGGVDSSGNSDFNFQYVPPFAIINQWGAIADTNWIDSDERVPVVSFHGNLDNAVLYEYGYPFSYPLFPALYGGKPIHEQLTRLGILNELHTLTGYGHEPELINLALRDTILFYSTEFIYPLLQPHTSAISGVAEACVGTLVVYSVSNTDGSQYCWQLSGNGTIVNNSGNSIEVVWNDTGTVQVAVTELNYLDAEGAQQMYETRVVHRAESNFNYSASELEVAFSNLTQNANFYAWDFGDNTFSNDASPADKIYAGGGTFTTTLIAANSACADTFSVSFTIDSCPAANITHTISNQHVSLSTPVTNTVSYRWFFGDGDSVEVGFPNVFHEYAEGEYSVVVIVKNQLSCETADTAVININAVSVAEVEEKDLVIQHTPGYLQFNGAGNYTLEILEATGKKISALNFTNQHRLSTSGFPCGLYFIRISDNRKVWTRKTMIF